MRIKASYSAILTMLFQKLSIGIKLHMAEMFSRKERKLDTILTQTSLEFSHTGKTILLKDLKFCWFFLCRIRCETYLRNRTRVRDNSIQFDSSSVYSVSQLRT